MRRRRRLIASCTRTKRGAFPPRELSSETFGCVDVDVGPSRSITSIVRVRPLLVTVLAEAHDFVGSVRFEDCVSSWWKSIHCLFASRQ